MLFEWLSEFVPMLRGPLGAFKGLFGFRVEGLWGFSRLYRV